MLNTEQIKSLRHGVLVEGKSIRQLARETGYSRNTVRKYQSKQVDDSQVGARKQVRKRRAQEAIWGKVTSILESTADACVHARGISAAKIRALLAIEGVYASQSTVQRVLREALQRQAEGLPPAATSARQKD